MKLGGQYVAKINSRYYYRVTGFELELGGGQLECNRFMELWADVDVILVSNLFMELCADTEVMSFGLFVEACADTDVMSFGNVGDKW